MKQQFIILAILALLFGARESAEFPRPPLDFSFSQCDIDMYRFELEPILREKHGFTERVQAQWCGCIEGLDFMFSYIRRGEEDFASPDYFSLLAIRRSKGAGREMWRFRFGEKWHLESCEFAKYVGNQYVSSINANSSQLKGMNSAVQGMLQDMMMKVKSHSEVSSGDLARNKMKPEVRIME